jgi:hypothetical protein
MYAVDCLDALVSKETPTLLHIRRTGFYKCKAPINYIRSSFNNKKFNDNFVFILLPTLRDGAFFLRYIDPRFQPAYVMPS